MRLKYLNHPQVFEKNLIPEHLMLEKQLRLHMLINSILILILKKLFGSKLLEDWSK